MIVAVGARLLRKNRLEGIGTFMDEVLQRIVASHPEIQFHFIYDHTPDPQFQYGENVINHVLFPPTKHVLLYDFWFNFKLPRLLKKIKAEAFLSLDSLGSLKLSIPQHLVLHDINFAHRPEDLPVRLAKYYNQNTEKLLKKVTRVATVSNYSKTDIAHHYSFDSERIDVVFNAAKAVFKPLNEGQQIEVRKVISNGAPYFFYVGSLHPRKNLINLLKAFEVFKSKRDSELKLLIAGDVMWTYPEFKAQMEQMKYRDEVILLGRLTDEQLAQAVASSAALTYIPFFEGFGIPIVEAFACKVPVLTSNQTCLPEIAGEGALQVDPENVAEIAHSLSRLASDPALRQHLIEGGQKELQNYSWDKTAALYWDSVSKILPAQ